MLQARESLSDFSGAHVSCRYRFALAWICVTAMLPTRYESMQSESRELN